MQQIERVGVIALLLMVVTIVVVALWDDGDGSAGKSAAAETTVREERPARPAADGTAPADRLRATRATERQRTTAPITTRVVGGGGESEADGPVASLSGRISDGRRAGRSVGLDAPDRSRRSAAASVPPPASGRSIAEGIRQLERERNESRREPDALPATSPGPARAVPASTTPGPAREAAPAPGPSTLANTYVVEKGDTLEGIARRLLGDGKRWRELQALNGNVEPTKLWVGKKLRLPVSSAPAPSGGATPARPRAVRESGRTYVVQAGDILGRIAQQELGSARHWQKIADINPGVDPDRLLVGTRLALPDVDSAEARTSLMAQAAPARDDRFLVR